MVDFTNNKTNGHTLKGTGNNGPGLPPLPGEVVSIDGPGLPPLPDEVVSIDITNGKLSKQGSVQL